MLLAIGIYGAFIIFTGFNGIQVELKHFAWWTFGATLGLSTLNYVLRFLKWEFYLSVLGIKGIPKRESAFVFLSGFALTVTPGKLGEMFKSAVLAETHHVPAARTAPIVLAERLTDVIAIVALVLIGSTGFSGGLLWAFLGISAVLLGLILIRAEAVVNRIINWFEKTTELGSKYAEHLRTSYTSLRRLTELRILLIPTLLSLAGWTAEATGLYVLMLGFADPISVELALFFYSTAMLAGALIPVPGGLGITEGMIQGQLIELGGVSLTAATAAMLLLRLATLWWAVLLGFTALAVLKRLFPKLLQGHPGKKTSEL